MKFLILLYLLLIFQSCNRLTIDLGQSLTVEDYGNEKILIPSGELVNKVDTTINQLHYTLGVKNNIIVFISSLQGDATNIININSKKLVDLKGFSNKSLKLINGWGYYISLENEWFAGFKDWESLNDKKKPDWFFKYNFPEESVDKFKNITQD